MRLLSLFCYNPTVSVDETTAHENIQGYYPSTVSLDEQTNEVGLCSAGVAIQDRFSACTGPISRSQLLHNRRPLVDRLLLDEEPQDIRRWPTSVAAEEAAASARAMRLQRRSLTIGTKRFVIIPVEENYFVVAVLSRGHVTEASSLEGPHPRGLRHRSGGLTASTRSSSTHLNGPASTVAGATSQEIDSYAKQRNQAPTGYKRHISAVTHSEDDVDDAVVDGVESYIRSYHDMFAMMYGTLTRNYSKIVQPLTKPMLRAMASEEEKDAAKARRSEQTARFRSIVRVGLIVKLVPRLRRWLLGSPNDGSSFISPLGMELLGVSGPAALAVSSISGVLQNAHPGALCGVVAMADGKVFHSTISAKDTSTLFSLVEHYSTDALDTEHDRVLCLAAAGPDRLLSTTGSSSSRQRQTDAIPYRNRRTGTLETSGSSPGRKHISLPTSPPVNPADDSWLMDSKRMLQAEQERAQCFRRSVHFGKPGHRLVGLSTPGDGGGGGSSAPMAAPIVVVGSSTLRGAGSSKRVGTFDMTAPTMDDDSDGAATATRASGVLMEQSAPRGAYRFQDPTADVAVSPTPSTTRTNDDDDRHVPRDAHSAALLDGDASSSDDEDIDAGHHILSSSGGKASSVSSSTLAATHVSTSSLHTTGGGEQQRAGSFVFVDGVPMGVINCELESIQLLLLVHEKFLSVPQLQAGLVQSVEEVLESVNGSDQLLSYIRPAIASANNSTFNRDYNYHYVNTMNHSVKSSIKAQLTSKMAVQLEEGITVGLQALESVGVGRKYHPNPQASSLIRSATLRATPLLSRTSDANPRSHGSGTSTVREAGGGMATPVDTATTSRQQPQSSSLLFGPASSSTNTPPTNPVLNAYFYELQGLLRSMPPPPRAVATTFQERQAAAKLPRNASLLEVIPYTLHVSKPPHVFSETSTTLPLNQMDAIRNFMALQGITDGGKRRARGDEQPPPLTLIDATSLSEEDAAEDNNNHSPSPHSIALMSTSGENPLRDSLARLGATSWCYYLAAEWREFCIIVEAESIVSADRIIKSVVRAVFTGLHQDAL